MVYRGKKGVEMHCVGFRAINFLHLTGVKTDMSALQFYTACMNERLSIKDIWVDRKGKVQQKLQVLPYLSALLYHNCMIGDFINSGIFIKADYLKSTILIINGQEVRPTEEDVDKCIKFLESTDSLICDKTVEETVRKYLKGELDINIAGDESKEDLISQIIEQQDKIKEQDKEINNLKKQNKGEIDEK